MDEGMVTSLEEVLFVVLAESQWTDIIPVYRITLFQMRGLWLILTEGKRLWLHLRSHQTFDKRLPYRVSDWEGVMDFPRSEPFMIPEELIFSGIVSIDSGWGNFWLRKRGGLGSASPNWALDSFLFLTTFAWLELELTL